MIQVTGNGAKANSAKTTAASRSLNAVSGAPEKAGSAPALKAGNQGTQTFTDEITHSQIQLPADAEAVGDPVTLSYNEVTEDSWRHIWNVLPASDGNGNIYYYYIKEVSATTGADVEEIGAVYAYENLSETDGLIHKVTITNTTTIREIDVNIHKISSEDTDQDLPDAEFTLRKKAGPGSEGGEAPVYNGYEKVKTSSDGTITFSGLTPGDYLLIEENAPSGFNRLTKQIEFTVSTDGTITGFDKTAYDGMVDLSDTNGFVFIIENEPGAELPYTGGPGTKRLYLLGIMLLGLAGAGYVLKWRSKEV